MAALELDPATQGELTDLAARFGAPLGVDATIDAGFDDPIRRKDRFGEVCMVIRRPNGKLLLSIKSFYPRGAYRLPTGGIDHGERVYDALVREGYEETGLELSVERFLARISYRGPAGTAPLFHTFAFLLRETGGTLGAIDTSEQIEDWREVEQTELPAVAELLEHLETSGARSIGGSWTAWGKFRAIAHRIIHEALIRPR